ncbi:MAG: hypothetical protein Q8R76_05405 [Candidatus Omnitrophota bacterium]|nr:hypothetical protein [Candidatus Omnitrophota bacterium]
MFLPWHVPVPFGYDSRLAYRLDPFYPGRSQAVNMVLWNADADSAGKYRATASLFIQGNILGPIVPRGTRPGDSNDRIPHEDLRVLRALRVFCALTDQSGIRSDNSLDVYVGAEGQGHTVHYLLDFGEALGMHGANKERKWDGFEHFFPWKDTAVNFLRLGVPVRGWERFPVRQFDPRGSFEAAVFDPAEWKETHQFDPIRRSLPDDNYWAAKIVGALTRDHFETLFKAVEHPDPEYVQYLIDTLMLRKEKILRHFLYRVSPLESAGVEGGELKVEDIGRKLLPGDAGGSYRIEYYDSENHEIAAPAAVESRETQFGISVPNSAGDYLRIDVLALREGEDAVRPVEFHLRSRSDGTFRLVGIVH